MYFEYKTLFLLLSHFSQYHRKALTNCINQTEFSYNRKYKNGGINSLPLVSYHLSMMPEGFPVDPT